MPTESLDLSVVIVSWNVKEYLMKCLSSVNNNVNNLSYEIIVIDNNSSDGTAEMIRKKFPETKLTINRENFGFARANNQAFAQCRGRYILLINPDTYLIDNSMNRLIEFLESHKEVGVVGPMLLNPDKSIQYICFYFPSLLSELLNSLNLDNVVRRKLLKKRLAKLMEKGMPFEVDWVPGACLILRSQILNEIGGLDEKYFLFSEEMEWCFRIKARGWKVFLIGNVFVIHYGSRSTKQNIHQMLIQRQKSRHIFFKNHRGLVFRLGIRFIYIFSFMVKILIRIASIPLTVLLPRDSALISNVGTKDEISIRLKAYFELLLLYLKPSLSDSDFDRYLYT